MTAVPKRPYLLRAMNEWINDDEKIPHIIVDATISDVIVPQEYVNDGKIVLNISVNAARELYIGNVTTSFKARFNGEEFSVMIPTGAIIGIYAKETGKGMVFSGTELPEEPEAPEQKALPDNVIAFPGKTNDER